MFCPKCGAENKDTARFCKHCGQPLPRKARPALAPEKMPWLVGILALAIVCVVAGVVIYPRLESTPSPRATELPREIERIIFEESEFAEPITWDLSPGVSATVHEGLCNFLVKNGYAQITRVIEYTRGGLPLPEMPVLFCTEAIKPYILSGSCEPDSYFTLLLARRKLKGIGFTNEYEQLSEKFYAVNFTYTLEEALPGLPDIEKEFEGKAVLYWDPSRGTWTLPLGLELEDGGYLEYRTLLP